MKQLMMERLPGLVEIPELPEGFGLRTYREGDWKGWVDACSDGLGTGGWSEQDFHEKILDMDGIHSEGIFFIVDSDGQIVGTATGWLKPGLGYVHMVGIRTDYRGKGLAKPLNAAVLKYLLEKGCVRIVLDTDDFRIPAIKAYLGLGFVPVLHDADMRERWLAVMGIIGLKALAALDAPGGSPVSLAPGRQAGE
jgi:mycothiol synthase